jgi:integrase
LRQVLNRLSAVELKGLKTPGYHHDGGGLYLQVSLSGGKSWILRYAMAGKRREMGLGPYPTVSLAAARKLAAESRSLVKAGQDPIAARDAERARQRLEEARGISFDHAVDQFLASNEAGWRNEKHRRQWRTTLATYASAAIGALPVGSIDTVHVTKVLDPIWHEKPDTASRVRGRIERILDWARVRGYRAVGENPARWRGHLEETYPPPAKVRPVEHHLAVSIDAVPTVYGRLRESDDLSALALRFIILTAARAGEAVGATWSEIDLDEAVWAIPGARMKTGRIHRVPLSNEAVAILRKLAKLRTGAHVFSGPVGRPLSVRSLSRALRKVGETKATVHGFRSTFRDWAAERTNVPRDVAEMALAHAIGNKVEAAYRRGELMEKRAALMQQWATFVSTVPAGNVVSIARRHVK